MKLCSIGVSVVYRNPLTWYACVFNDVTYLYDKVCYQPKNLIDIISLFVGSNVKV